MALRVQGQREKLCRLCYGDDDKDRYYYSPVRALYIREAKRGFRRVGWYFEKCGHVEFDVGLV